jgi:alpha-galactosidase
VKRGAEAVLLSLIAALAGCGGPDTSWYSATLVTRFELTSESPPLGQTGIVWLDELDIKTIDDQWSAAKARKTVNDKPLTMAGQVFPRGVGTHASSEWAIDLKGEAMLFRAAVGVDDETERKGSVVFSVWVDDRKAVRTQVICGGEAPRVLTVDLKGARRMWLVVEDGGDGIEKDHADWGGAMITLAPNATGRPEAIRLGDAAPPQIAVTDGRGVETPATMASSRPDAGASADQRLESQHGGAGAGTAQDSPLPPDVHAPRVVGATIGRPFLFRVPATGTGPLTFTAQNLPPGLAMSASTGIITGAIQESGTVEAQIGVEGPGGLAAGSLTIVCEERSLAQTPPMGWNSWNVWGTSVDDAKVRAAADWMDKSGLAAHGFAYINIDDAWEAARDAQGRIQSNGKFPDMKALADYVHSKGLKLGIYSSPGPKTCAGFEGSMDHELDDARTYAEWGVDLLKYDWCSYGKISDEQPREELQRPYRVMRAALDQCGRDIVYSICQYGRGKVWEWGHAVGGNYWRTTGDIVDNWMTMSWIGFGQDGHEIYAGPGHWNDPDMLVVGKLGWGPSLHATRLTPNEQITHITLWSLLAAPLLIGCDLSDLDRFTLDVLTNPDVLEVNQDALGRQARRILRRGTHLYGPTADIVEVWSRPLSDGAVAVGLFNRGVRDAEVKVDWSELGLRGPQHVRNLWLRRDEGVIAKAYGVTVPRHGAAMLRLQSAIPAPTTQGN